MLGAPGSGKGTYAKAIAGNLRHRQFDPTSSSSSAATAAGTSSDFGLSDSSASPVAAAAPSRGRGEEKEEEAEEEEEEEGESVGDRPPCHDVSIGNSFAAADNDSAAFGAAPALPILSTGDMLRAEIAAGTDLGIKAKGYADRGQLVPDQLVIDAVLSRLDREAAAADPAHVAAPTASTVLRARLADADARYKECSKKSLDMEMERYATPAERVNGEAATLKMGAAAMKAYAEAESLRQELSALAETSSVTADASSSSSSSFGFILDGFPRTTAQAAALEAHRGGLHAPTTVVNVQLDQDVIVAKLLGRRVCPDCGTSYNVAAVKDDARGIDMPAMAPPPACASKVELRSDDTEAVVEARLAVYAEETAPLVEYYRARGNIVDFVVKKGMQDVDTLRRKIRKHEKLRVIAEAWAATTTE